MLRNAARSLLPAPLVRRLAWAERRWKRARAKSGRPVTEDQFRQILHGQLHLEAGDIVFVHSSVDYLCIDFPFFRILAILLETVGPRGTLLFPTYPQGTSIDWLERGETFDVRRTRSYMGALTELARRHSRARRSLHPTKSVCAIGPRAEALTCDHHRSPYPHGTRSPFYRLVEYGGKIVGLGVSTRNLSFVHCVDDVVDETFPVRPYDRTVYEAACVDGRGRAVRVTTFAHDPRKMVHDVPRYMDRYIPPAICRDLRFRGMVFFRADAKPLFDRMSDLARQGVTIYPRRVYEGKAA
jgi:aminoglycoside N3'-acetyltransferase